MINLFGALANAASAELEAEGTAVALPLPGEGDSSFADCLSCIFEQFNGDTEIQKPKELRDGPVEALVDKKTENDQLYPGTWQMNRTMMENSPAENSSSDSQSHLEHVKKELASHSLVRSEKNLIADRFDRGMFAQLQGTGEGPLATNVDNTAIKPERFPNQESSVVDPSRLAWQKAEHADSSGILKSLHDVGKADTRMNSEVASGSAELDLKLEIAHAASRPTSERFQEERLNVPTSGMETALQAAASGSSNRLTVDRYAPGHVRSNSNQLFSESGEFSSPTDFENPLPGVREVKPAEVQMQSRVVQGSVGDTETQLIRNDIHSRQDNDPSSTQFTNSGIESKNFEQAMELSGEPEIAPIAESIIGQLVSGLMVKEIQEPEKTDDAKREITIQIHPEELGHLEIKIESGDNGMTAEILASEAWTSDLLNREREALMDALREKGIDLPNVNISHQQAREGESDSRQSGSEFQFSSGQKRKSVSPMPTIKRFIDSSSQVNVIA